MPEDIKFCKDCKFNKHVVGFDYCSRTKTSSEPGFVDGFVSVSLKQCRDERYSSNQESCGKEAKFFEPSMGYKVTTFVKNLFKHG